MSATGALASDGLIREYAAVVALVEDVVLTNLRSSHPLGRLFTIPASLSDDQVRAIAAAMASAARVAAAEAREAA